MSAIRPWAFCNPNETILDKRNLRSAQRLEVPRFRRTSRLYHIPLVYVATSESGWASRLATMSLVVVAYFLK
jgi:hypothetical protein